MDSLSTITPPTFVVFEGLQAFSAGKSRGPACPVEGPGAPVPTLSVSASHSAAGRQHKGRQNCIGEKRISAWDPVYQLMGPGASSSDLL